MLGKRKESIKMKKRIYAPKNLGSILSIVCLFLLTSPTKLSEAKQEQPSKNTDVFLSTVAQNEPIPEFDYDDLPKTMIVQLTFDTTGSLNFDTSKVFLGLPPARIGNPPLLQVEVFNDAGNSVEIFNAWDPRWIELHDINGIHQSQLLSSATGYFFFPFGPDLKEILVINVPENQIFGPFDIRDGIRVFCEQNPNDVDCVSNLTIVKSASVDPVIAGETLEYTITITNNGPNPAHSVQLLDKLPIGVTYQSANADCTESPVGTLNCNLGILVSGETRIINITVVVDAALVHNSGSPTTITNQGSVSNQAGAENTPDDNDTSVSTQVVAAADLEIVSFNFMNPLAGVLVGRNTDVNLHKIINNNGPSAPMDVNLTKTAIAPADSTVTPISSESQELALGLDEHRSVFENFKINCGQPGQHSFTFTNQIQPTKAEDTDPIASNNTAELNVNLECVVPVSIDIIPKQINIKKNGVVSVLVLNNRAGERGLPLAFDASTIDPLSVRFGQRDLIWTETGGAPEAHNRGHKNSRGMMLHFTVANTGLVAGETEACLKGTWTDANKNIYKFFGCDKVQVRSP